MENNGIHVLTNQSQICILTFGGELIEKRINTERPGLDTALGGRPAARILIEASTEGEWVARHLEGSGHEDIVADPNCARMRPDMSRVGWRRVKLG
jgi:hypothetical protein